MIVRESINFNRADDPYERMDIGMRPKMLKMIQLCHMESRDAAEKYFGRSYLTSEVTVLKSILWWIYFDKKKPDEAYTQSCINLEKGDRDQVADVLKKELGLTVKYLGYDS